MFDSLIGDFAGAGKRANRCNFRIYGAIRQRLEGDWARNEPEADANRVDISFKRLQTKTVLASNVPALPPARAMHGKAGFPSCHFSDREQI
ncbi:MAG: hypothetical protein AAF891_01300 [Pseudomonadota bacterium]